jgi:transposase
LVAGGLTESKAVQRVTEPVHRSTYQHWKGRYAAFGFEGLIDCRLPEPRESIPEVVQQTVVKLRRMDAAMRVEDIGSFIDNHYGRTLSPSSVKRILKRSGLHRSTGRPAGSRKGGGGPGERLLSLGGMKLVEAAAVSTGYLDALTQAVVQHVAALPTPENAQEPDVGDRDDRGRFLPSYNERYRKGDDDVVGPGFASVELKRELKDPSLFHVHGARPHVVERKLWALMCSPLIGTGKWDGLRTPRGDLLRELCGFSYMPSTLSLFTSELKYAGVASELWEVHAQTWHSQTQDWGSPRHAAVLYVDGTTKPIFTSLFSQSTHVSLLNRTMPGLDVVGFHSGYGVPLLYLGHSGRAPLVRVVPKALDSLEEKLGAEVGRIVVIDAEGNAAPFLAELQGKGRAWVTRLRPSMVEGKPVLNWTSFRPYRDNDRIREGELDLRLGKRGTLRVRLVEIERRASGKVVHLAASKLLRLQDWRTDEVADLYFARWPNQELDFRAVSQATGVKQVRGYGKRLVQNVAVTTKLETVTKRIERGEGQLNKQLTAVEKLQERHSRRAEAVSGASAAQQTIEQQIDERLDADTVDAGALRRLTRKRRVNQDRLEKTLHRQHKTLEQIDKAQALAKRTEERLGANRDKQYDLETKLEILAHDVELDSLFNVLKVGFTLLITYVLRKMLDNARMVPATFLDRIANLPAWQRVTDTHEFITFKWNSRDPRTMALLAAQCDSINAMQLPTRGGCILHIAVEEPPRTKDDDDSS